MQQTVTNQLQDQSLNVFREGSGVWVGSTGDVQKSSKKREVQQCAHWDTQPWPMEERAQTLTVRSGEHYGGEHAPQTIRRQHCSRYQPALLSMSQTNDIYWKEWGEGTACGQETTGLLPGGSLLGEGNAACTCAALILKPQACTKKEHCTKGLSLPTMRRSVSGRCLKSFLKSSFRCL